MVPNDEVYCLDTMTMAPCLLMPSPVYGHHNSGKVDDNNSDEAADDDDDSDEDDDSDKDDDSDEDEDDDDDDDSDEDNEDDDDDDEDKSPVEGGKYRVFCLDATMAAPRPLVLIPVATIMAAAKQT